LILDNFHVLKQEALKISWPSINEAASSVGVVVLLMSIFGICLGGIDYILGAFDQLLLNL
jgi:preprotein translocase SecE subunit